MATSTFAKQFSVKQDKADEFVNEMTRPVSPTLRRNFRSQLTHAKNVRDDLKKALSKR